MTSKRHLSSLVFTCLYVYNKIISDKFKPIRKIGQCYLPYQHVIIISQTAEEEDGIRVPGGEGVLVGNIPSFGQQEGSKREGKPLHDCRIQTCV